MNALGLIRTATDQVEDADSALEEVAALGALHQLVTRLFHESLHQALVGHTSADVARALGLTRQAVSRRARAARNAERAGLGRPVPQPRRKGL
jgi:DNA-directed RNA polymerase specialized sigma24 family protein